MGIRFQVRQAARWSCLALNFVQFFMARQAEFLERIVMSGERIRTEFVQRRDSRLPGRYSATREEDSLISRNRAASRRETCRFTLHVLSTLFFEPIRRIERFGWRKMAENEKLAGYYYPVRSTEATVHQEDTRRVTRSSGSSLLTAIVITLSSRRSTQKSAMFSLGTDFAE